MIILPSFMSSVKFILQFLQVLRELPAEWAPEWLSVRREVMWEPAQRCWARVRPQE